MALADFGDVTTHLPMDKFPGLASGDLGGQQAAVERMVKGWLVGIYDPVTLAGWATPDSTPQLIREVAARMIAALYYRKSAATEVSDEDSAYAQRLYNEALDTLRGIREGSISLEDVVAGAVVTPSGSLGEASFYPNNAAPAPLFTMDRQF